MTTDVRYVGNVNNNFKEENEMNRFKKTIALTAACVIAATTVNVGSVAGNDVPKVKLGSIVASADEIGYKLEANGLSLKETTTEIKIIFASAITEELTRDKITLDGAELADGDDAITVSGTENKVKILKLKSISKKDGETVNVKIDQLGDNTFSSNGVDVKVNVETELESVTASALPLTGKKAEDTSKTITIELDGKTVLAGVGKSGFVVERTLDNKSIESVAEKNGKVEIKLARNIEANEVVSVTYDAGEAKQTERLKVTGDKLVQGFTVNVANNVEASDNHEVKEIKPLDGEKDKTTTTKLEVKFNETTGEELKATDFVLDGAKVSKATVKENSENKIYILEITDVTKVSQKLSTKKIDTAFTGVTVFDLHMKPIPSTGGGGGRSSVRPDSSTPANKEDAKKDEMKNEPKKDEMKKDEVSNATSTDKVSTKLVIGQKTYTAMVNGQAVEKTMDVAPMVHQGRTVLPARMISELLGVDVKFDQKSKTANFMYGEAKVQLTLGQKFMLVNGEKVALSADILNKDGRILLPVTDIQKAFAKLGLTANVSWDAATKSVTIEK